MLCVLWYSCENTVLELDHVSLDLEKIAVLTSTGKMYFEEQTVIVETNSTEKKGQCATASAPTAVQRLHCSCLSDTVASMAVWFWCLQVWINRLQPTTIWSCGSDFQFIPKPEIFWWQFPPSFQGTMRSKLSKTTAFHAQSEILQELLIFFFLLFLTNLRYH